MISSVETAAPRINLPILANTYSWVQISQNIKENDDLWGPRHVAMYSAQEFLSLEISTGFHKYSLWFPLGSILYLISLLNRNIFLSHFHWENIFKEGDQDSCCHIIKKLHTPEDPGRCFLCLFASYWTWMEKKTHIYQNISSRNSSLTIMVTVPKQLSRNKS